MITFEAIRKYYYDKATMRVWIDNPEGKLTWVELNAIHDKAKALFVIRRYNGNIQECALAILNAVEELNAIEIVNYDGQGVVLYRNWP